MMKGFNLTFACGFLLAAPGDLNGQSTIEVRTLAKRQTAVLDQAFIDSQVLLFDNLRRQDISPGAVIASPSRSEPDYFYHWTRDAALTHASLYELFQSSEDTRLRRSVYDLVKNWISFESFAQQNALHAVAGLGEPIFFVNGYVNTKEWGRPQTDGPALRATIMSKWAEHFLSNGEEAYVRETLYRAELPATSLIKRDLEFVAHHWRNASVDLWEEVRGKHFFTLAVQRKALLVGAELARKLNDSAAADFYEQQAAEIRSVLGRFLNAGQPYVVATLDHEGGWQHKHSNLDISVTLAVNHALAQDDFYLCQKDRFTKTLIELEKRFQSIYQINHQSSRATALGRYPEDVYDGSGFSGGNPWFLATHGAAEYYCRLAKLEPTAEMGSQWRSKGLGYLERSLWHRNQDTGEMSEQYSRHNGYLVGARHLTWSYASYLTAYLACR